MLHQKANTTSEPDSSKSTVLKHLNWGKVLAPVAKQKHASQFDQYQKCDCHQE